MSQFQASSRNTLHTAWWIPARRWMVPAIFLLVICGTGAVSILAIRKSTQKNLASKLTTILETDVTALTIWTDEQKRIASYLAQRLELRSATTALAMAQQRSTDAEFAIHEDALVAIDEIYREASRTFRYVAYRVISPDGQILAGSNLATAQAGVNGQFRSYLDRVLEGQTVFIKPSRMLFEEIQVATEGVHARPMLWVAAPVSHLDGEVIAAIALGISPEEEFTDILSIARAGDSGETFAFDDDGWLLSDSRFDAELQRMGLLKIGPDANAPASSVLNVRSLNNDGELTALVDSAIQAKRSSKFDITVDLSGTTDYRGVEVVGASQWLPQYDFGVVTKLDYEEAYAPSLLLRNIVAALLSLSLLGVIANVLFARRLSRLQRRAMRAEKQVRQLGQYTLLEKIGEGGMGEVYRAKHSMLRRPTAVKLLRADRSSEAAIARFEQEVQMTAMLTHPNTIAIYDYGRTPEGTFYYAMEYLSGLDLKRVIDLDGPQPAARVIMILRQVCRSLSEAHEAGLIHRDIKPGNVILFRRGSRADIVKVLDFGLVRDMTATNDKSMDRALAGTPAYMSPESFRTPSDVDARSDIYAVGAIGYYLLTGTDAINADLSTILSRTFVEAPVIDPPSHRLGRPVDGELSEVLMSCLQSNPNKRPQTAADLSSRLTKCEIASQWSRQQSMHWWDSLQRVQSTGIDLPPTLAPRPIDETLDG